MFNRLQLIRSLPTNCYKDAYIIAGDDEPPVILRELPPSQKNLAASHVCRPSLLCSKEGGDDQNFLV